METVGGGPTSLHVLEEYIVSFQFWGLNPGHLSCEVNRAYPLEAYILILSLPRFLCSPAIVRGAVLFYQVLHAMMLCLTLGSKVMELAHYGLKSLKYKPSS